MIMVESQPVMVDLYSTGGFMYTNKTVVDQMMGRTGAMILAMNPARPAAMDETLRLRFEVLKDAIDSKDRLVERVVIMKDIDVSWGVDSAGGIQPEDIDDAERSRREEEWRKGAEEGYELARNLGVDATVACSRTGEGVNEVIHDLAVKVLEQQKLAEAEARRLEEEARQEAKRARSCTSRFKRLIAGARSRK